MLDSLILAAVQGGPAALLSPALILVLCLVAGMGTILLLPARREPGWRKIGGVIVLVAGLILGAMLVRTAAGSAADQPGVYFWIFSFIALAGALRVVTHPRPVYSALYFVLTVLASAGLFVLLWAEFMAAALVLIYAGAILVTYVFVIMLASGGQGASALAEYDTQSREPVVAAAVGFLLMAVLLIVIFDRAAVTRPLAATLPTDPDPTRALGHYLFQNQLVNFELAGVILTMSMVGAILIARRRVLNPVEPAEAAPAAVIDDNPHTLPIQGTDDPRQKVYPET